MTSGDNSLHTRLGWCVCWWRHDTESFHLSRERETWIFWLAISPSHFNGIDKLEGISVIFTRKTTFLCHFLLTMEFANQWKESQQAPLWMTNENCAAVGDCPWQHTWGRILDSPSRILSNEFFHSSVSCLCSHQCHEIALGTLPFVRKRSHRYVKHKVCKMVLWVSF